MIDISRKERERNTFFQSRNAPWPPPPSLPFKTISGTNGISQVSLASRFYQGGLKSSHYIYLERLILAPKSVFETLWPDNSCHRRYTGHFSLSRNKISCWGDTQENLFFFSGQSFSKFGVFGSVSCDFYCSFPNPPPRETWKSSFWPIFRGRHFYFFWQIRSSVRHTFLASRFPSSSSGNACCSVSHLRNEGNRFPKKEEAKKQKYVPRKGGHFLPRTLLWEKELTFYLFLSFLFWAIIMQLVGVMGGRHGRYRLSHFSFFSSCRYVSFRFWGKKVNRDLHDCLFIQQQSA